MILSWLLSVPGSALSQQPGVVPIDFETQIKPILVARCYACHSQTTLQGGGVRLDNATAAKAGGYSQRTVVGGTLETNELYLRVSSQDPSYRMPKGQPALTDGEIALIRSWVAAGTPWPDEKSSDVWRAKWFDGEAWMNHVERWLKVPGLILWLCSLLVVQLGVLFVERYKRAVMQQRPWTLSPRARILGPLKSVGTTHYLLLLAVMSLALSVQVIIGMQAEMQTLNQSLEAARNVPPPAMPLSTFSVYGNPPIPVRPTHPRRLSGEYYRGNCERHADLFNGGNYRTATLRVSLVDRQGRAINYGDRVVPGELSVRFELERAKGTTEHLFGDAIEKGTFLCKQPLTDMFLPLKSQVERVRAVKPGWNWEATYPLESSSPDPSQTLSGLIYVYQGTAQEGQARGTYHFGIQYKILLKEQVVQPDSELWMGSLFWSPALEHPNQGKIPMKEWFNDEPIPEVTGKNSTDPNLLGITEHRKKQEAEKAKNQKK